LNPGLLQEKPAELKKQEKKAYLKYEGSFFSQTPSANKKCWEELILYFVLMRHGLHKK
jgi:hypothetical protein